MRIVNEPIAALVAYGCGKEDSCEHVVVIYGVDGVTLDRVSRSLLSSCESRRRVLGIHRGGQDFDNQMAVSIVDWAGRKVWHNDWPNTSGRTKDIAR